MTELTEQEALLKAIEAHKAGDLTKADKIYTAILFANPNNSDANHNMGVLALDIGKASEGLPFLKKALDSSSDTEQFWISYIEALLRLEKFEEARATILRAIGKFEGSEYFKQAQVNASIGKLRYEFPKSTKIFYAQKQRDILSNAALGWVFSLKYESEFQLRTDNKNRTKNPKQESVLLPISDSIPRSENSEQYTDKIQALADIESIEIRYKNILEMINRKDACLIADDFSTSENLSAALEYISSNNCLNVVVIGAGVTGLFIANALKNFLKEKINILVLDNRIDSNGIRKVFDRDWLTDLPSELFRISLPKNISTLISCFGKSGKIGIPINVLESLLMLSCRELGIKFCFSENISEDEFRSAKIELFVNATGGKLEIHETVPQSDRTLEIDITGAEGGYEFAGIMPLISARNRLDSTIEVSLQSANSVHKPYYKGNPICAGMIKVTNIQASLLPTVRNYVHEHNHDNLFYVWEGKLHESINSSLLLISLDQHSYRWLSENLCKVCALEEFIAKTGVFPAPIDERIVRIVDILLASSTKNKIKIEPPFKFDPYIKLFNESDEYAGIPIFPIGDTLLRGNPKVGNGLGYHLKFINEYIEYLKGISCIRDLVGGTVERESDINLEDGKETLSARSQQRILNQAIEQYKQGDFSAVLRATETLLEHDSNQSTVYNLRGAAYVGLHSFSEAIYNYKIALGLNPLSSNAHNNLGVAFRVSGMIEDSIVHCEKALEIDPNHAEARFNLGCALEDKGNSEDALDCYRRALKCNPNLAEVYKNIGNLFLKRGDRLRAITNFEYALENKPGYEEAAHLLASAKGEVTAVAPQAYVEQLFDNYAEKFEASLVEKLKYNVPEVLAQRVLQIQPNEYFESVLDMGCGTGLAGKHISGHFSSLVGIDLSKAMLEKAEEKRIYSELLQTDILSYLKTGRKEFDLIVATDVFVYIGDLRETFSLIRSRVSKSGIVAFSTEHSEGVRIQLNNSGRYSHSKEYIESLYSEFSLNLRHFEIMDIRKEEGAPIKGGLYILEC